MSFLKRSFLLLLAFSIQGGTLLNKTGDGIGACCRGRQKSAYGYIWKFKN